MTTPLTLLINKVAFLLMVNLLISQLTVHICFRTILANISISRLFVGACALISINTEFPSVHVQWGLRSLALYYACKLYDPDRSYSARIVLCINDQLTTKAPSLTLLPLTIQRSIQPLHCFILMYLLCFIVLMVIAVFKFKS